MAENNSISLRPTSGSGLPVLVPHRPLKISRGKEEEEESSSSAASLIGGNRDLLIKILVYLPINSLVRFQSVSKLWLSIITEDPFFCRLHFTIASSSSAHSGGAYFMYLMFMTIFDYFNYKQGFVRRTVNSVSDFKDHFKNLFESSKVHEWHTSNGLLAIALYNSTAGVDTVEFFVYNPATRKYRIIPPPQFLLLHHNIDLEKDWYYNHCTPPISPPHHHSPIMVSPDPLYGFMAFNIAFHPSLSHVYKLVYIWQGDYSVRFAIYQSDTQLWRDCPCMLPFYPPMESPNRNIMFRNGVFWNGNLHWPSHWWYVFCLDLDTGREKPMPPLPRAVVFPPNEHRYTTYGHKPSMFFFGVSGQDLCLIGLKEPAQSFKFNVFKLELDYSRWDVKYCVDLSPLLTVYPSMVDDIDDVNPLAPFNFYVLGLFLQDDNTPLLMISIPDYTIIFCDRQGRVVKIFANVLIPQNNTKHKFMSSRAGWWEIFQYFETFASV